MKECSAVIIYLFRDGCWSQTHALKWFPTPVSWVAETTDTSPCLAFYVFLVIVFKNVFWYYIWEYLICKYENNLEARMLLSFSMQIICPELFTIPIGDTISNEI